MAIVFKNSDTFNKKIIKQYEKKIGKITKIIDRGDRYFTHIDLAIINGKSCQYITSIGMCAKFTMYENQAKLHKMELMLPILNFDSLDDETREIILEYMSEITQYPFDMRTNFSDFHTIISSYDIYKKFNISGFIFKKQESIMVDCQKIDLFCLIPIFKNEYTKLTTINMPKYMSQILENTVLMDSDNSKTAIDSFRQEIDISLPFISLEFQLSYRGMQQNMIDYLNDYHIEKNIGKSIVEYEFEYPEFTKYDDIIEATILSVDDYIRYGNYLSCISDKIKYILTKSINIKNKIHPVMFSLKDNKELVSMDLKIKDKLPILPALIFNDNVLADYNDGDSFRISNYIFIKVSNNTAICNQKIGYYKYNDYPTSYEESALKHYVDLWFESLVGRKADLSFKQKNAMIQQKNNKEKEIYFGNYKQGAKGEVKRIKWIILNKTDDCLLVISKYPLIETPYNAEFTATTWETSDARKLLNEEFINEAFSKEETERIIKTTIHTDDNQNNSASGGNDTIDKVFILSAEEYDHYFPTEKDKFCTPTPFATSYGFGEQGFRTIHTRSPGQSQCQIKTIEYRGSSLELNKAESKKAGIWDGSNVDCSWGTLRPAMWIKKQK